MAVTVTESIESRRWEDGVSGERIYVITGTADEATAITNLKSTAPDPSNSLVRQPVEVEPVFIDSGDAASCIWRGVVRYAPAKFSEFASTGDSSFQFETSGEMVNVKQSLSTTERYDSAGPASGAGNPPDFKGAIGVTDDAVEGVNILVPKYRFSETHYIADATVTSTYKGYLYDLTGKVNDASFKGFSAGEVLFVGARGSQRGEDDWEITFTFEASPNQTGLTIGDIGSVAKEGHEYLWVRYEQEEDATANKMVTVPKSVHVEQVYESGDFSNLGIGTT